MRLFETILNYLEIDFKKEETKLRINKTHFHNQKSFKIWLDLINNGGWFCLRAKSFFPFIFLREVKGIVVCFPDSKRSM